MLAKAFAAAKAHVKKTCEKECCDKVVIWVQCTKDFEAAVKQFGTEAQQVLCDNKTVRGKDTDSFQNTFDCKK